MNSGPERALDSNAKDTEDSKMTTTTTCRAIRAAALGLSLLLAVAGADRARAEEWIAVKGARVLPVSGPPIENGTVLVRDGRIEAVGGPDVAIPWQARTLDGTGKTVIPGFVLAHTSRGLDSANENVQSVPFVSVLDALDPVNAFFEDSLRDGVTTICVMPGNRSLIGGQGMIVKPYGLTVEAMTVKRDAGLKISMEPGTPGVSRMGQMQRLRRTFVELQESLDVLAEKKAEAAEAAKTSSGVGPPPAPGDKEPELDAKKKPLADLVAGHVPAYVYCGRAADVDRAFELAETFKFRIVPVLGPDCWKAAKVLAEKKVPVILDADLLTYERDEETRRERKRFAPEILRQGGVTRLAFTTDSAQYGSRYLWYQAALAVRNGMDASEALKCVTQYPAEAIGLADRVGSLEPGKDGNFVILSGDPLDYRSWVETVVIEGKIAYRRDEDARLKRVLPAPAAAGSAK
jgi:imidazolonepropionase-like amidohydrolase